MSITHDNISALQQLLAERYGFDQLFTNGTTDASSLFMATSSRTGGAVEVELFNEPITDSPRIDQLNTQLPALEDPAVFPVRACGTTPHGLTFVVREAARGQTLRSLIDARSQWSNPFTAGEAESLLGPVAAAIDRYAAAGHPDFLSRAIDVDRLMAQQGPAPAPVMLQLAGPTPNKGASQDANRRAFATVLATLTGTEVNESLLVSTSSCAEYLREAASATPESQPAPEPEPDPEPTVVLPAQPKEPAAPAEPPRRPRQEFPDTDPGVETPVVTAAAPYETSAPAQKRSVWPWVAGVLVLLAVGGGGTYWYLNSDGLNTTAWEGEDAELAETFPQLISERNGGKGFNNLKCEARETTGAETAKIRCFNADAGINIYKFDSTEARDAVVPIDDITESFGNDVCEFESTELRDQDTPSYFIAPDGDLSEYLLLVNGADAEQLRLQLPIC